MDDIFFKDTVTVFNNITGPDVLSDDTWAISVLHNVRLRETRGANVKTTGLTETDAAILHIMLETADKPYADPMAWAKLSDKSMAFTFHEGKDFFVKGDLSGEALPAADIFNYVKKNFSGVYRVTTVDKYTVIPHIEVGGK